MLKPCIVTMLLICSVSSSSCCLGSRVVVVVVVLAVVRCLCALAARHASVMLCCWCHTVRAVAEARVTVCCVDAAERPADGDLPRVFCAGAQVTCVAGLWCVSCRAVQRTARP